MYISRLLYTDFYSTTWFPNKLLAFIALLLAETTGRYSDLVRSIIMFIWWAVIIVFTTVAFLLIGLLASKHTGRARTGTLAGLVAGLTGWTVLWMFYEWVSSISKSQRVGFVLGVLIMLSIGAGIGTLGGLIGKGSAKVPPANLPG
jgi:hypothetical protein